jgi:flagellum-specific peptidoglycan hydrolase FlgJ
MTNTQIEWLNVTAAAAKVADHVWPEYAACEAATESTYGVSVLATQFNNLFGMKQHALPQFQTANLPTREYIKGAWVNVIAPWIRYPNVAACFKDRMATLVRLRSAFPHYDEALAAQTGDEYVTAVSKSWSTDPFRAKTVLAVYQEWKDAENISKPLPSINA